MSCDYSGEWIPESRLVMFDKDVFPTACYRSSVDNEIRVVCNDGATVNYSEISSYDSATIWQQINSSVPFSDRDGCGWYVDLDWNNDGQFDGNLAAMASNLARAVAGLSAESRQRDKHAQRAIENMSDTEKLSVIKHWLATSTEQDKEEYRVVLGFGSLRSVL